MIRSALRRLAVLPLLLGPADASAQTERLPLARVFVETTGPESTIAAIARPEAAAGVGLRIQGDIGADAPRRTIAAALEQAAAANVPVWLVIAGPASATDAEGWRQRLKELLAAHQPSVLEITFEAQPPQLVAYAMQLAATEARVRGRVAVALGGSVDLASVYAPALAPYVDAVAVSSDEAAADAARLLTSVDPGTPLLVAAPWTTANDGARRYVTDALLRTAGTAIAAHAWPMPDAAVRDAVSAVTAVDRLLGDEVTELDPSAAQLHLSVRGEEISTRVPHRLLFDGKTLATLLVYWGDAQADPLSVRLSVPTAGVPAVYDVLPGRRAKADGYVRNDETAMTEARLPLTGRPMLVDFTADAAEVFAERSGVEAARQLSADEIIARHRQQQARQDAAVDSYIASARLQQHFRPTVTDPGYDVVTENRYFVDREGIEWEELSFSVNGSKWGSDRPPFPLLQPEKVLSLPLQLRFDEDYRYRLAGTGRTGGYDCYLIEFEPVRGERSLYRGTLWIDKKTFARVRVQAVQTRLGAPIVSNEEDQVYRAVTEIDGAPVFLLGTLTARQIVLIAGRNLLLEKVASFDDFRVNAADFAAERAGARASERVMYRETDRGLRYFVKEGETRVVSERQTTSAKAMAIGVTMDPSYDFPLPILGINYLDFEFRNPQTQLAVLFAGVLAAGNVQRPRVGDSPFDASIDFFAIAVPSNDRLYDGGGARASDALLTWPLTAGGNLGWQSSPFQKLGVQYQFRFDGFVRDRETAETFRPPPSTTTHGVGLSWEYRRRGYGLVVNGLWNRRLGWREWGDVNAPEDSPATYAKYSAVLSRDFVLGPFQKVHVDAAWFGGRDLDRLSRYQFGLFDATRIHGVPASGLRFDDLVMARGGYSFNIFEQYRLDLFLDQAWGRDRTIGSNRQSITGIGAAVNVRAPWQTILRADIGRAFLPDRHRGLGSTVVQVMLLKPIR